MPKRTPTRSLLTLEVSNALQLQAHGVVLRLPRITRPGPLLVREHAGVLHRVMILDAGVTWNGRTYDSLSQVAFAITGTKWNGPRFFGLRDKIEEAAKNHGKPKAGMEAKAQGKPVIGRGRAASFGRTSSHRTSP